MESSSFRSQQHRMLADNDYWTDINNVDDWIYFACSILCVISAGLASGLTMGLLSVDRLKLQVKMQCGTKEERKQAEIIMPLIMAENHHYLLVTLLLFNAVATEALPVLLGYLVPDWLAILISVLVVLIAGEIIPASLFTGPNQLKVAAQFSLLVYFLEGVFFPIAYPVAQLLDCYFGVDTDESMTRDEISAMLKILYANSIKEGDESERDDDDYHGGDGDDNNNDENSPLVKHRGRGTGGGAGGKGKNMNPSHTKQHSQGKNDHSRHDHHDHKHKKQHHGHASGDKIKSSSSSSTDKVPSLSMPDDTEDDDKELSSTEVGVITGVLGLAKKTIHDIMIPWSSVTMISNQKTLDSDTLRMIKQMRHSRLLAFNGGDRSNIIGVLNAKDLIHYDHDDASLGTPKVLNMKLARPLVVNSEASLLDVLHYMHGSGSHIAIVSVDPFKLLNFIDEQTSPSPDCAPMGIVSIEDILSQIIITAPEVLASLSHDKSDHDGDDLSVMEKARTSEMLKSWDANPMTSPRALSPGKVRSSDRGKSVRLSIIENALLSKDLIDAHDGNGDNNNDDDDDDDDDVAGREAEKGDQVHPLPNIKFGSGGTRASRSNTPEQLQKVDHNYSRYGTGGSSSESEHGGNTDNNTTTSSSSAKLSRPELLAASLSERLVLPSKEGASVTRPSKMVRIDSRRRKESIDNLDLKDIL